MVTIKKIGACLMTCLFFAQLSHGEIIKDDKTVTARSKFSFEEACEYLTKRKSPLIDYKSITSLSCMGEVKDVAPFCDYKEAANPYFIRAIVLKDKKQVECLSAKKVILKYKCEGAKDKLCLDSEIGCFLLREKLAKRLKTVHESLTDNKTILNCYYEIGFNSMELGL